MKGNKMKLIEGLDIPPFTKIFWKKENDKIVDLIQRASHICNLAEYETVRRKLRKVYTFHVRPRGFEDQIERITNDGLFWIPIQRSKCYEGFSHKHFPTSKDDPQSTVYGAVSWKLEYAQKFKKASQGKCDHKILAELLGYPKCCANFFTKVWAEGYYDPIWQAAENTEGAKREGNTITLKTNGYANECMRYFGLRIVPQLTCSFQCEESEKQGKMFLKVMKELDEKAAEFLLDYLKGDITWSVLHGIAQIETRDFIGITNSMPATEKFTINIRR